ncbi:MAG: FliM/FliN family flagellar motor switch protein [Pseudomonadota bacterium]
MSNVKAPQRRKRQARVSGGPLAGGTVRSDNLRPAQLDPKRPFPTSRGILSAAEIEALLRPDLPAQPEKPTQTTPRTLADLDAPNTALDQDDAERLCARLGLAIHRATGLGVGLKVVDIAAQSFRSAFPAPEPGAAFACFGAENGDVDAVLALSSMASLALVDVSCGAEGRALREVQPRALTEIDTALLDRLLRPLADHLPGGCLHCLENRAAFTLSVAPPGPATRIDLELKIEGFSASGRLILSDAAWHAFKTDPAAQPAALGSIGEAIAGRELTALLTARIASLSVPVSRLANLKPGDTLLLGLPADEPVQLLSGGRQGTVAAEGEIGRKGAKMAVRVTKRGPALR